MTIPVHNEGNSLDQTGSAGDVEVLVVFDVGVSRWKGLSASEVRREGSVTEDVEAEILHLGGTVTGPRNGLQYPRLKVTGLVASTVTTIALRPASSTTLLPAFNTVPATATVPPTLPPDTVPVSIPDPTIPKPTLPPWIDSAPTATKCPAARFRGRHFR